MCECVGETSRSDPTVPSVYTYNFLDGRALKSRHWEVSKQRTLCAKKEAEHRERQKKRKNASFFLALSLSARCVWVGGHHHGRWWRLSFLPFLPVLSWVFLLLLYVLYCAASAACLRAAAELPLPVADHVLHTSHPLQPGIADPTAW